MEVQLKADEVQRNLFTHNIDGMFSHFLVSDTF